ncbi:MAG TPA: CapA family protein [Acidimicrobiales bacterium]|nr:CapA family protein [Acidimicrobiales bacterium]
MTQAGRRRWWSAAATVIAAAGAMTIGPADDPTPSRRSGATAETPSNVLAFGDAPVLDVPTDRAVAMSRAGRWGLITTTATGRVDVAGEAMHHGSVGNTLAAPVVAIAPTTSGDGYWLFARDGGVFTFGDATFHGSTGAMRLNEPIVGAAATPTGRGYWLLARDRGVFTFGDATFHGSAVGRIGAGRRAVAMSSASTGDGYWIATARSGVRVAVAGDVHGERHIADAVRRGEPLLTGVRSIIAGADIAAVNLETPASRPGSPQAKEFVFLAPPELLDTLKRDGVDVVSLANNHALDHGVGALLETLDRARHAGLVAVGAGRNVDEAFEPRYVDAPGGRVGFVGLSRVVPNGWAATPARAGVASAYDTGRAMDAVRRASAAADHVVVLVHWGVELARCPSADLVRLAEQLHAAGADVVAGHHPHVLQGTDLRPDRATAYSLGNFVWYHNRPPSDLTAVLDVELDDLVTTNVRPARIGGDGRPVLLDGSTAEGVRRAMTSGPCWHP